LEKDVAAGEAESCYRSFHAAVLGLTVRYRWSHQSSRSNSLLILGRLWDAEDADGGAVANDRVLGSRVGWARACVAEELGMAAWEPEEKDLSLVVSLLLACCIVPGLDGVFSGHLVCPRCGG
jgi:hypothetical protein